MPYEQSFCYSTGMPKFRFDKLVRDKIVAHQIASGAQPHYRTLSQAEHKTALINKINEEAQEILGASPEDMAAEIADVQQALDDLKALSGLTDIAVKAAQEAKNAKNGAFREGIFVEYIEIAEDDEWTNYYRKNPDRYQEIE